MNIEELKRRLFTMSNSEWMYKKNPDYINPIYGQFDKTEVEGQEVVNFSFDKEKKPPFVNSPYLHEPKLEIVKHSRYSNIPIHVHDYIEMNYVYSGSCVAVIQNKRVPLKMGDVCILDTGVPHTIKEVHDDDIVINFLMNKRYFTTSMLSQLSSNDIMSDFILQAMAKDRKHNRYLLFRSLQMDKLKTLVEYLLCEFYDPSVSANEIINAYVIIIFSELLTNYRNEDGLQAYQGKNQVMEILKYIEEQYKVCSLESVAKYFSFHPNYLSRLIKQKTGKSFKKIVQEQRLNQAEYLIKHSDKSIAEIMTEVGYQNHGFFNNMFKEKYGVNPKEYRRTKMLLH
ncbi:AraC family transcriptional regulator [Alkalihalobacillus trypoxylicola]|uniref:HTH araC/xylS-type domain-containing protein n=1 Tax=Alkalihalobacillus trypoxylicola TaxID=519424 RepID=A0A161PJG7_9BACI|nr:AraC family transcriptional regulator [Alkalihalobacillus trypoxylicola]KYG29431.1 hypothetical protein AZF04_07875 [Alkalihalobacillus trypoxylicola]GAF63340.1 putative DNA-binding protein [Bacillus sp. TS-2]